MPAALWDPYTGRWEPRVWVNPRRDAILADVRRVRKDSAYLEALLLAFRCLVGNAYRF